MCNNHIIDHMLYAAGVIIFGKKLNKCLPVKTMLKSLLPSQY